MVKICTLGILKVMRLYVRVTDSVSSEGWFDRLVQICFVLISFSFSFYYGFVFIFDITS